MLFGPILPNRNASECAVVEIEYEGEVQGEEPLKERKLLTSS